MWTGETTDKTDATMHRIFITAAPLLLAAVLTASSCGGAKSSENEFVRTVELDGMKVSWLRDNAEPRLMPAALFSAPDSLIEELGLEEGVPSSVSTFLLETGGHRILFDTGLGAPDSRLLTGLESLGYTPADIDLIYLTHLHGDHTGGMLSDSTAIFPNAEVYISYPEYVAWAGMEDGQSSQLEALAKAYEGKIHLFEFGDTLPGGVEALDAVGHTPGHTAYRAGKLLIVGDLMHGVALQLEHNEYCANFDMDKAKAVDARRRILALAADGNLLTAGMHFPVPGFIQFEKGSPESL